jgi:hypothetical protein
MSYQTGSATTQLDFMTKLKDFAVAAGWTQDEFDSGNSRMALHKSTVYVQMHWDGTNDIGLWQSLNFTGGQVPGNHPNDSGNIASPTGAITSGRRINTVTNGPYISHHFFASGDYLYACLQISVGTWVNMGWGKLTKLGNWTGGEFAFASFYAEGGGTFLPGNLNHSQIFDALCNVADVAACMHVEGLPGQGGTGKWGVFTGAGAAPGNDDAAVLRVSLVGSMRDGPYATSLAYFKLSAMQGFVPLIPIPAFYHRRDTTPDHFHPLGFMPDIRQLNIGRFNPEQEIVIGPDTWIVFPMIQKLHVSSSVAKSGNGGFAIKKIT